MNDNLTFYRKYPIIYNLTSDDTFYYIKYTLWILGFILNLILIIFFRRDSNGFWFEGKGETILVILGIIIAALGFIFTSAWFFSRYNQKVELARKTIEDQERRYGAKLDKFQKWMQIHVVKSVLKEAYPIIFLTHTISSVLGIVVNPVFYTVQLLLIAFLFDTTTYVVQAITTHFD